ncbi:MAG: DUF3526 domain-containing protein [Methylobacterium sp.]|uniref:DUF3526 domain-containing protein n=1 Tax=Methylobacterium sp. TaxID=409 RepID=UPI00271B2AD3|nr:DUF3526 domain-containing protein [Methylobacterium sp.]MDO9427165.1 DUF3526 domain-containing protein [Methylobacterium sp.]
MSRALRLLAAETGMVLREKLTWAVLATLFAALLLGAHMGAARVDAERAALAGAAAEEARAVATARETFARYAQPTPVKINAWQDPTNAFGYMTQFLTVHAVKPPSPLAALATGQSDVQPALVRVSFGSSTVFNDVAYELGSAARLKLGAFDFAFVLTVLVPLAVIALAGTRLSAEGDSGTLRLIAAQPIGPRAVAGAKFGAVAGILVAAILAQAGFALWATGAIRSVAGTTTTLALLAGTLAAYILLWVAACALVATLWRGAVAALSILVLAWTLFTVVVPAAASLAADLFTNKPSRIAAIDASRQVQDAFINGSAGPRLTAQWLNRIPGAAERADLVEAPEIKRLARDAHYDAELDAHRESFRTYDRQIAALSRWLALASPVTTFDFALQGAAGTDAGRHAAFLASAAAYRRTLRAFFEPRIVAQALNPVPVCGGCQARLDFDAYDAVPRFQPTLDLDAGRDASLRALAWLTAVGVGLALAAWVRLRIWPA